MAVVIAVVALVAFAIPAIRLGRHTRDAFRLPEPDLAEHGVARDDLGHRPMKTCSMSS
jgi:hypothetical protein